MHKACRALHRGHPASWFSRAFKTIRAGFLGRRPHRVRPAHPREPPASADDLGLPRGAGFQPARSVAKSTSAPRQVGNLPHVEIIEQVIELVIKNCQPPADYALVARISTPVVSMSTLTTMPG